jgi:peptidoglycan/xylan/chitin deacetylase (PgdA/CDA1 family)
MYGYSPGDLQSSSLNATRGVYRSVLVLSLCAILIITGAITYATYALSASPPVVVHGQSGVVQEPAAIGHSLPRPKTPSKVTAKATVAATHTHPTLASNPPAVSSRPVTPPKPTPTRPATTAPLPVTSHPIYSGSTTIPEIALTFDDGPNPYYTPQVLSVLRQYGVQATFFDVGYLVQDYPAIVQEEYAQGHIVADHSWSHPDLTRMSIDGVYSQLAAASNAIHSAIGVYPSFFRPPYGSYDATVIQQAISLNLHVVMWDDDPRDWSLPGTGVIIARALGEAHNGSIILMHDGGGNRWQTVAALPTIITTLRARGYRLVTIQQLLQDMYAPAHTANAQFALSEVILLSLAQDIWKREAAL